MHFSPFGDIAAILSHIIVKVNKQYDSGQAY